MTRVPSRAGALRTRYRAWRRGRPFWAGTWTLLAGAEILFIPLAQPSLMIQGGIAGVSGLLMGVFLLVLGLTLWLAPRHRAVIGVAALLCSVASLVLSNFGGFLIGFLMGVAGGAMAVDWMPDEDDDGGHGRRSRPVPDWGGGHGTTGPDVPNDTAPAPAGDSEPTPPTAS
ncbi:DUF6114 domain-containing protein [Actinacidiphila sp. bgisy167]|uniref:DUF6114 domain-containing protein n=1 Tax=Actinacidiphila sp. bgisy167 TaxID=3413797 RepID=UPI003D74184F